MVGATAPPIKPLVLAVAAAGIVLSEEGFGPPMGGAKPFAVGKPAIAPPPTLVALAWKSAAPGRNPVANTSPSDASPPLLPLGVGLELRLDANNGVSPAVLLDAVRSSVPGREDKVVPPDETEDTGAEAEWLEVGGMIERTCDG